MMKTTYGTLFLLLGFGSLVSRRGNGIVCLGRLTVSLCLGDFTWNGLAAAPAGSPLCLSLFFFLVFLVRGFGNFYDYMTTVKLLLVKELDGLLGGL